MQPQQLQYTTGAALHYQRACQYADEANAAYAKGKTVDTVDMLLGLGEMQVRLGHLSLAVSRRDDYIRHGARRGNGGNQNTT